MKTKLSYTADQPHDVTWEPNRTKYMPIGYIYALRAGTLLNHTQRPQIQSGATYGFCRDVDEAEK